MKPPRVPDRESEARLDALRQAAADSGPIERAGVRAEGAPLPLERVPTPTAETGYYGLPLLKEPTWTWEVPVYFFVGGAAGAAAVVGAAAGLVGGNDTLARDARWIAAAGAALSPPLLIFDLGRPERFLNMLRVFKVQSPMSVGAWTLAAFSTAASAAAFADLARRRTRLPVRVLGDAAGAVAAATGVVMSSYTGVLVGATAIPAWSDNARVLPLHFSASGLASAVSLLELLGHRHRALNRLGVAAAATEMLVGMELEARHSRRLDPLKRGRSGALTRLGGLLSGPIPLVLRLAGGRRLRRAAALSALAGSLLTRFAWVAAGHASARDGEAALTPADDR